MSESEAPRRYMTPKEYLNAQRERGGCAEDFKETMIKSGKLGIFMGVPLGCYVAYMNEHKGIKPFATKIVLASFTSTMFMGVIGLVIGTFNCLRVSR